MARSVGIIAYGTPDDRLRLEALAKLEGKSASQWLIEKIREEYREIFSTDEPPEGVCRD